MKKTMQKKRKVSLLMLSILIILVIVIAGSGILLFKIYRQKQSSATSIYSNTPTHVGTLKASDYRFVSFLPLFGNQNSAAPIDYGNTKIIAGNLQNGNAILAAISDSGAARWEVELGGKLISCARQAIKNELLPCLYHSSEGNGVALINLTNGISKWIWLSADNYINIAVGKDENIYLLDSDLSITKIDQHGALLDEVLLARKNASKQYYPDTSKCNLDEQALTAAPERLDFLSSSIAVLTHSGINYILNMTNGDLLTALPGKLVASSDKKTYVIAPVNDCTSTAIISPNRNNISLLPQNQFGVANNPLGSLIVKDNQLHQVSWTPFKIEQKLFPSVNLKLSTPVEVFSKQGIYAVLSNGTVTAVAEKPTQKLWSFSDSFKSIVPAEDTLIYSTSYGDIKAVSFKEGASIWTINTGQAHSSFSVEDKKLVVSSPAQIDYYSFESNSSGSFKGAPSTILKSQPGLFYDLASCVRISQKDGQAGNALKYSAYLTKVDCKLEGAQEVGAVITSGILPRSSKPEDLLKECNNTPDITGVITVSSSIDDPNLTAICTKPVSKR